MGMERGEVVEDTGTGSGGDCGAAADLLREAGTVRVPHKHLHAVSRGTLHEGAGGEGVK